MENIIILRLLLTIVFGAILGLETETREVESKGFKLALKSEKTKIGGLRTYTVISLLGGISGILYNQGSFILSYILFGAIILFVLVAYVLNVQLKRAFGITTEIAVLITFIIGFLTTTAIVGVPVILVVLVLLTFFLSQKRGLGAFIAKINHKEVIDVVKFGLVAIVILPLLPNSNFSLQDIVRIAVPTFTSNLSFVIEQLFNPFQIWLTVVIISGISLITYILSKFIGSKASLILSGILGGFISSTSAIAALTLRSKNNHDKKMQLLLAGIAVLSNTFSLVTVGILIFINSTTLLFKLTPFFIVMFISGILIGLIFYFATNRVNKTSGIELKYEPFSVFPAIKFVAFILIVRVMVQVLSSFEVSSVLLILITSLSGFAGIDAPSVAFSGLFANKQISIELAMISVILTIFVNTLGKSIYAFVAGNKRFALYITVGMILSMIVGIIPLLIS